MAKDEQRYMKNLKTGVQFVYKESQVTQRPEMVECNVDGKIIVNEDEFADSVVKQQAAQLQEVQAVAEKLTRDMADLRVRTQKKFAEVGKVAGMLTATECGDSDRILACVNRLLELAGLSGVELEDVLLCGGSVSENNSKPDAETSAIIEEPDALKPDAALADVVKEKEYSVDDIEAMKDMAREVGLRGFTKMSPAELDAALERKK